MIKDSWASVWEDISMPLQYNDPQKILIYGGALTLTAAFLKSSISKRIQTDLQDDKPLCCKITRPGNSFLQIAPNIIYSLAYGLDYYFKGSDDSKLRALGMARATLYSGLVTDLLKPIVHENRPDSSGHNSFPSGHTTTAFAFASFVASEHPWYVGTLSYAMASFVGFCRMHDNHHYLHDVLGGATIGTAYGLAMSLDKKETENKKSALLLLPSDKMDGLSLKFSYQF